MATTHGVHAVVGLTGFETESDGLRVSRERFARIELPQSIRREHIEVMRKDFEELARIAEQFPDDLVALENAVLENDLPTAIQLAGKVGLSEERIAASGGGKGGVLVGIAIVVAFGLLLESDTPPPPPPPPPPPTTLPPDAGTG